MIFAELNYKEHYDDCHQSLLEYVNAHFERVDSGHQGDSWIWIYEGENKVALDTFSSMKHQVKSETRQNPLVQKVIEILQRKYDLVVYSEPESEAHED